MKVDQKTSNVAAKAKTIEEVIRIRSPKPRKVTYSLKMMCIKERVNTPKGEADLFRQSFMSKKMLR